MTVKGYIRYVQTADILAQRDDVAISGQIGHTYKLYTKIPVILNAPEDQYSGGARIKLNPYQDWIPIMQLIVPGEYSYIVDYSSRIQNIRDREDNVLESGPFEIIAIQAKYGWNGKKHHLVVGVRQVVEK